MKQNIEYVNVLIIFFRMSEFLEDFCWIETSRKRMCYMLRIRKDCGEKLCDIMMNH